MKLNKKYIRIASEQMILYHGTDKKFDKFEVKPSYRTVLFSQFEVIANGHFFATTPEQAKLYGSTVLKVAVTHSNLLLDPRRDKNIGVDSFPEAKTKDLEYILEPMLLDDPTYGKCIDIGVSRACLKPQGDTYVDKYENNFIYYCVGGHGMAWDCLDNPEVVNRMKARGYDGTFAEEDGGGGFRSSVFILDSSNIKILGVVEDEPEEVDDYSDEDY